MGIVVAGVSSSARVVDGVSWRWAAADADDVCPPLSELIKFCIVSWVWSWLSLHSSESDYDEKPK